MASPLRLLFLFCIVTILVSFTNAQLSFRPKALVLPVSKDASTLQYLTTIKQRNPVVPVKLVLDLGGRFLWVDCDQGYVSSTYNPVECGSDKCILAGYVSCGECEAPAGTGCSNNSCVQFPQNTVNLNLGWTGLQVGEDVLSLQSTDGKQSGSYFSIPHFLFTCGSTFFLEGFAKGVTGMLGLGRTRIALPLQLSSLFSLKMRFAICLPSSTAKTSTGVVFFGGGPYIMKPNIDISSSLTYTPLIVNPVSTAPKVATGERSSEYFIGITSIRINKRPIKLNATLLTINRRGHGGSKISTVNPYTVMETSIYKAFTTAFVKATKSAGITAVASVAPFDFCFSSNNVTSSPVGPVVPTIDLVLQSKDVVWSIFGANSMVRVKKDVLCLGFLEGGSEERTSIIIGGHQLEDNLLQFDLKNSRIGFSSSLLSRKTSCSKFNFTSSA